MVTEDSVRSHLEPVRDKLRDRREKQQAKVIREQKRLDELDAELNAIELVLDTTLNRDFAEENQTKPKSGAAGFVRDCVAKFEGEFAVKDVVAEADRLGFHTTRNAIQTALSRLAKDGYIETVQRSSGRSPAVFRVPDRNSPPLQQGSFVVSEPILPPQARQNPLPPAPMPAPRGGIIPS